jgi:putative membrane protein
MKIKTAVITLGLALAVCAPWQQSFADEASGKATMQEKMFIKKAAEGGMTEVKLGEVAQKNGGSDDVKDFGKQMVDDHTKINDNLKEVAGKMNVTVPSDLDAKHQAMVDKLSALHGAAFDNAYVKSMVKDHKMDIAEFEKADKKVKNDDLKSFIENSTETMKGHLEKIEKFSQAK